MATITIHLDSNDDAAVLSNLAAFFSAPYVNQPGQVTVSGDTVELGTVELPKADEPKPEPAKRGRKTKTEAVPVDATPAESVVEADPRQVDLPLDVPAEKTKPAAEEKALTIDDVREALKGYTAAKSIEDGIQLLQRFGCSRISELLPEQYAEFIKDAKV